MFKKAGEVFENILLAVGGFLTSTVLHKATEKAGEAAGEAAVKRLKALMETSAAELITFWQTDLRREDREAAEELLRWMSARKNCLPRDYGANTPYGPMDENKATEALSALQSVAKGRQKVNLFKALGHMTDERRDTIVEIARNDNASQLCRDIFSRGWNALDTTAANLRPAIQGITARLRTLRRY